MPNSTSPSSQFTLREILFATTLSFIGMAVLNSVAFVGSPVLGCVVALIATVVAGCAAVRFSAPETTERFYAMVVFYLAAAVLLVIVINVVPHLRFHRILRGIIKLVMLLGLPTCVGLYISVSLFPAEKFAENERWKRICLLGLTTMFVASIGTSVIQIQFLSTRGCGGNSTAAAAACKAYAEAQMIYRRTDYDGNGVKEFARSMFGDSSLLETKAGAQDLLLLDPAFAQAAWEHPQRQPKAGYYFKVLHAGGCNCPYIDADGFQTLGFAMLAFPAQYDKTGRESFLIDASGRIHQKDLGPETLRIADDISDFMPDATWTLCE